MRLFNYTAYLSNETKNSVEQPLMAVIYKLKQYQKDWMEMSSQRLGKNLFFSVVLQSVAS